MAAVFIARTYGDRVRRLKPDRVMVQPWRIILWVVRLLNTRVVDIRAQIAYVVDKLGKWF
ncbi:MAG: hypothetical protein AAFZ99_13130 [Pseudomonadota bacterium]